MTSPLKDILGKRRYRKHRQKVRKRELSSHHEKVTSKTSKAPHVTHKRLTNKTGFYFSNAVVSSPQFRRKKKENSICEPQKSSTDFDLFCLLKAAKGSNVATASHSVSISTSTEECDEPISFDDISIEKGRPNRNLRNRAFESGSKEDTEVNSLISSEKNLVSCEDIPRELYMKPSRDKKDTSRDYTDDKVLKENDSEADFSKEDRSSEPRNTVPTKRRPGSFSSYYKFAIGVVDAINSEKKKRFPSDTCLKDVESHLIGIYNKSHCRQQNNEEPCQDKVFHLSDKCKEKPLETNKYNTMAEKCPQSQVLGAKNEADCEKITCGRNYSTTNTMMQKGDMLEEKAFKERTVEAWVAALPENVSSCINNKPISDQYSPSTGDPVKKTTEDEFLNNSKRNSFFVFSDSDPAFIASKPETSTSFFLWDKPSTKAIQSPIFSPHMLLQSKNVNFSDDQHKTHSKLGVHRWTTVHSPEFVPCKNEKSLCKLWNSPSKKCSPPFWEVDHTLFKEHRSVSVPKQQSWYSWFRKQNQHCAMGDIKMNSYSCLSPTHGFFEAPISKRTCVRPNCHDDWPSASRNQIFKSSKKENKKPHDIYDSRSNYGVQEPCSPLGIKFSPRKMF